MTNTIFAKFCNDGKLVDKKTFQKPDIDMVWSKVAGKEKKVSFEHWVKMLAIIAEKKGLTEAELQDKVLSDAKVKNSGTVGASRFYDDKVR
ncbi:hypothetical protein M885DRAFT_537797 [Pelagophyceae sp. CCMP2097]|nr:hypothetical protein M885DRAFT_537797 [Pelagophyceae sp. CCMP2097]